MLLSAAEMREGFIEGPPLAFIPQLVNLDLARRQRRSHHWRRFTLGDIEPVTVTPPVDLTSSIEPVTVTPPVDLSTIAPISIDTSGLVPFTPSFSFTDIPPPAAVLTPIAPAPATSVAPSAPAPSSSDAWARDLLALAQVAGQTFVGVTAAQHGLPPGVTGGPGIGPGPGIGNIAAMTPAQRAAYAAMYPGLSPSQPSDFLSSLFGGSSMTSMLLLTGVGVLAVVMLTKR